MVQLAHHGSSRICKSENGLVICFLRVAEWGDVSVRPSASFDDVWLRAVCYKKRVTSTFGNRLRIMLNVFRNSSKHYSCYLKCDGGLGSSCIDRTESESRYDRRSVYATRSAVTN
jgi:hypothetical protein